MSLQGAIERCDMREIQQGDLYIQVWKDGKLLLVKRCTRNWGDKLYGEVLYECGSGSGCWKGKVGYVDSDENINFYKVLKPIKESDVEGSPRTHG